MRQIHLNSGAQGAMKNVYTQQTKPKIYILHEYIESHLTSNLKQVRSWD